MKCISITDKGAKRTNKDFYFQGKNLFIVCDGVDGQPFGAEASKLACNSIADFFAKKTISKINIVHLNKSLAYAIKEFQLEEIINDEMKGMASTVAMLAADIHGVNIAWLGDSRVYHVRKGKILFMTEDHSTENELRRNGNMDENYLKTISNWITKELSATTCTKFSTHRIKAKNLMTGDYFFLCTDGVLENVNSELLCKILKKRNTLENKSRAILAHCTKKTHDNYTFQLVRM